MSATVIVYCTTDPGVVVATSAALVMVRPGISTVTLAVQAAGAVPEAGQVLPGVAEVTVSARTLLPVSGLLTVTENVMVADCPGSRSPVPGQAGAGERDQAGGGACIVVEGGVVENVGQRHGERRR